MFTGYRDETCAHAQAKITEATIGERVRKFVTVMKADHGYWGRPLDQWVYDILVKTLQYPEHNDL